MKILIVCSGNANRISAFIVEQAEALCGFGVQIDYFTIYGKGMLGYLGNLKGLKQKISSFKPDLIHAHYGLSGLLAVLQFKIPVVVTFHNGEILSKTINAISSLTTLFSKYDIYVAEHIRDKMFLKKKIKFAILPCGIDLKMMRMIDNKEGNVQSIIDTGKVNILFGGSFDNKRKNYELAKQAIDMLGSNNVNLIELVGFNRTDVAALLNACDLALLPSKSEGSPQFIKEAMACNCPIVATDVGDIKNIIWDTEGCYITSFDPKDVAEKIKLAIKFSQTIGRTRGREKIKHFDNKLIAKQIHEIYQMVLGGTL